MGNTLQNEGEKTQETDRKKQKCSIFLGDGSKKKKSLNVNIYLERAIDYNGEGSL